VQVKLVKCRNIVATLQLSIRKIPRRTDMTSARHFIEKMLEDRIIDENEVAEIADFIAQDGVLDMDDVKLLVELYCGASSYPESFEELFFGVLRSVLMEDNQILAAERFYLLKMLHAGRSVRPAELAFLEQLKRDASAPCPELEKLIAVAKSAEQ
jgi:hypothetical protein